MSEEVGREKAIVFIDDAHTFGGAQIALAWAIRALLRQCESEVVVCVCTSATRAAIQKITEEHWNLRFIDCPPALPLNIFAFPLRLWAFHKLLRPWSNREGQLWFLNLAGIEFCLAPLLIIRLWGFRPVAWLHNEKSLFSLNAHRSQPRKVLCRLRDAVAMRLIFRQYHRILTPSHAAEISMKDRFRGNHHPQTGFLYPNSGVGRELQLDEIGKSPSGSIDLWMIGRVEYGHKNNLAGLKVLRYLKEQKRHASLTIVGNGPDMEKFVNATREWGLSEAVNFMGWEPNPWKYVPRSAIVLIPSHYESFCLVAKEAMQQGVRMVLSPLPVFFEWIPSELIAHEFRAEAFAKKVEAVSALSPEHVLALYKNALDKLTDEAFVAKFLSILRGESGEALGYSAGSSLPGEV